MSGKLKRKKVLVVDDNGNMAQCLSDMVAIFGVSCEIACDGKEAIDRLKKEDYSLIIADTRMPKISGFTLLKHIRENHPDTQVAIISTRDSDITQGMVVRDKPDFYLPKPFRTTDIENLLSKI